MTTTDTPADELRAAAKLMRERAEAATPGPWTDTGGRDAFVEQLATSAGTPASSLHLIAEMDQCGEHPDRRHADAAHIAGLDPLVALAVADWLDGEAVTEGNGQGGTRCDTLRSALAVARAYLAGEIR